MRRSNEEYRTWAMSMFSTIGMRDYGPTMEQLTIDRLPAEDFELGPRGRGRGMRGLGADEFVGPEQGAGLFGVTDEDFEERRLQIERLTEFQKTALEEHFDLETNLRASSLKGWGTFYSTITQEATTWKKVSQITFKDVAHAAEIGARDMLASFIETEGEKATVKAASEFAEGVGTIFKNPAESATHFAAAALWGTLGAGAGIAAGMIRGGSPEMTSGDGRSSVSSESSDTRAGTREVSKTTTATTQNLTVNVFVNHTGAVVYGDGGIDQLWRERLLPLARESVKMGELVA
jgi:hypothetical protein